MTSSRKYGARLGLALLAGLAVQAPARAAQPGYGAQPTYGNAQSPYGNAQPPYGNAQSPYGPAQPPYAVAQQLPDDPLSRNLKAIAANPHDVAALMGAGKAALSLGDPQAALTFFGRAEEVMPNDGRIKLWMGSALVQLEQPATALKFFRDAATLGVAEADLAGDRGLAYDISGDPRRAQRDYRLALSRTANPEITRRLALSLAISGEREPALFLLQDQLRERDRAAERTRALVLALTGDSAGAERVVQAAMPGPQAAAMAPFLVRLQGLGTRERALAVHLGMFPGDGRTSAPVAYAQNDAPRFAAAVASGEEGPQPALGEEDEGDSEADGPRRIPGAEPGSRNARPAPAPARRSNVRFAAPPVSTWSWNQGTPPEPVRRSATPQRVASAAPPVPRPVQPAPQAAGQVEAQQGSGTHPGSQLYASQQLGPREFAARRYRAQPPVSQPASQPPVSQRPVSQRPVSPTPDSQTSLAHPSVSPAFAPPHSAAQRPAPPEEPVRIARAEPPRAAPAPGFTTIPAVQAPGARSRLAEVAAALDRLDDAERTRRGRQEAAPEPVAPAHGRDLESGSGRTAAARAGRAAAKAKPVVPREPSRHWVQIAGGANKSSLPRAFAHLKVKAPKLFAGHGAWTASVNATNRLLVGPFDSEEEAQEFVNKLAKADLGAFAWTSEAGERVERLPAS